MYLITDAIRPSYWLLVPAFSRASSLPQFDRIPTVRASLLAKGQIRSGAALRLKRRCLKDTSSHALKATNPCAIAYSQARIRRLVRLGGWFYCGAVAECSVIGFSSSANFKAREYCHYVMAALRGALRCAGILEPGLLTRVKPPPLRLAAMADGSISQGASP